MATSPFYRPEGFSSGPQEQSPTWFVNSVGQMVVSSITAATIAVSGNQTVVGSLGFAATGSSADTFIARSSAGVLKFANASATYDGEVALGAAATRLANVFSVLGTFGVATNKTGTIYVGADAEASLYMDAASATAAVRPVFVGERSRGTQASRTDVQNGDAVATFIGRPYSGATGFWDGAEVRAVVDGTFTTNQRPPSRLEFYTNAANAAQTLNLTISGLGSVVCGSAAIATNATDGFFYAPGCAGAASGTPTTYTGRVPMVFDSTNFKLYAYCGAWKSVTLS